jgi:hypothetical protein
MSRFVFLMLAGVTLASCKTNGLIPGKFEAVDGEEPFREITRVIDMIFATLT